MAEITFNAQLRQPPRMYCKVEDPEESNNLSWWNDFASGTFGRLPNISNSRLSAARVSSVAIGMNDANNTATIAFPPETFGEGDAVVGSRVTIKAYWPQLGVGSTQIFRGIVITPEDELSSTSDGNQFTAVGYKFVLNSREIHGAWMASDFDSDGQVTAAEKNPYSELIFNKDGKPDRSPNKSTFSISSGVQSGISAFERNAHVFARGSKNAKFWKINDILEYIIFLELCQNLPGIIRVPAVADITLDSNPKVHHYDLTNSSYSAAITKTIREADPLNNWYIDDINSYVLQSQRESDLVIFNTKSPNTNNDPFSASGFGIVTPQDFISAMWNQTVGQNQEGARRINIASRGAGVTVNPNFHVGSLNVRKDASDVVNRIYGLGAQIEVETTIQLEPAWAPQQLNDFHDQVFNFGKNPDELTNDPRFLEVFRHWRLPQDYDFSVLETRLTQGLGAPTAFGIPSSWFFPEKFPLMLPNLITTKFDPKTKKQKVEKLKVYADFLRNEDTAITSFLNVYEEITGQQNGYKFDSKTGTIKFPQILAYREAIPAADVTGADDHDDWKDIEEDRPLTWVPRKVLVTAVIKTDARLFYDTEKQGNVPLLIERTEDTGEKFKVRIMLDALWAKDAGKSGIKTEAATNVPLEWENKVWKTKVDLKQALTGDIDFQLWIPTTPDEEDVFHLFKFENDKNGLIDFIDKEVDSLKDAAIEATWSNPRFDTSIKPGMKITRINNGGDLTGSQVTVVGLSFDLINFITTVNMRNK